jgi:hypothetical protein
MDWTAHEVAKEDLPPVALMTFKDLRRPYYAHELLRLHYLDATIKRPLDEALLHKIEHRAMEPTREPDIRPFHHHRVRADRLPDQGRYAEAVIEASLAIESFIRWLLARRNLEVGTDEPDPSTRLQERGVTAVVRRDLHPWLGGQWDLTRADTPVGRWLRDMQQLRNRCVHAGYRPTYREADKAVLAGKPSLVS